MSTKKAIYTLLAIIAFVYIVEKLLSTRVFMWLLRLSFEGDEKSHWLHCFPPLSRSHRVEEEGRRLGRARTAPTFILQSSPPPGGGGDGAENYGDGGDGGEKYGDGNQDQDDWGQWQINLPLIPNQSFGRLFPYQRRGIDDHVRGQYDKFTAQSFRFYGGS